MKLLLDTNAFLWWNEEDSRLSARVADAIRAPDNTVHLSLASVWEVQIKAQLGKLRLLWPLPELLRLEENANGIHVLPFTREDIFKLSELPNHHRDPFDRLIAAQALRGSYQLATNGPMLSRYGVTVVW